ncbi:FtsK/SpoIIIE domain-containing protein [Cytobacillus sp. FSL R7-0696]|uniref:FtsK/SpoIIIE domain-containing protein n=1 Tax=Cytobacillus sp. FSL R7-0696 TaxID=2921691 RepID=UPI0030FD05ED
MLFELLSSAVVGGLIGYSKLSQRGLGGNDTNNISRIAENAGLVAKDGTKIRPYRRTKQVDHTEYVFHLPQGLSSKQFREKVDRFQDGLNAKKSVLDISIADLKALNWRKDLLSQLRKLARKKRKLRKEVEIEFDGMLKFRVYNEALTDFFAFDRELLKRCNGWQIPLGMSRKGFVTHDMESGHLIVAGATTYGKSVFLKNLITSTIARKPEHVRMSLIDLKGGLTFARYQSAIQVDSVAKDIYETLDSLREIDAKITAKEALYLAQGYENIREACDPYRHFIIIDEAAEIASAGITDAEEKKARVECERILARIARIGASLGFRLIFCTQYPTADTLPRQIKQNVDTRVCFRLQTKIASEVVLDEGGADQLPRIKGRAIYQTPDGRQVVQTPLITNEQISEIIGPHINIRARKDDDNANANTHRKGTTPGTYTLKLEKTRLS